MFQLSSVVLAAVISTLDFAAAQQYPPPVTYDHVLKSPINPNITISYKSPDPGTCTTAFSEQKQYSGYINLPPNILESYQQNYSINTFFWFFEARNSPETAPLTIWLNGGPGSSSMVGLFREAGPCEVVQLEDGSYGTQFSTWGWDRSSNVLFIDQPTQTGFSYDEAVNGTLNLFSGNDIVPDNVYEDLTPWAFLDGTFPSGNSLSTQNTSLIAASASWHFLQGFLSAFPQYNPGVHVNSTLTEPAGINLFAESYGGQYGPAFAQYFTRQNARRATGQIPRNSTLEIKLASLGIINGLVDSLLQAPSWPKFAFNNSYGIRAIDHTTELNYLSDFSASGGCKDLTTQCRDSMTKEDPQGEGDEGDTNDICKRAFIACRRILGGVIEDSGRSPYDITAQSPDSFPNLAYLEYLNTADVLRSIGAKVNYTESNSNVFEAYTDTGDEIRGTQIGSLASLLSMGIRVAFLYGDSDMICNWYGGQDVSLELARTLPTYSAGFPAAGYADIIVNSTYVGGQVRQYGNLSFSRIYDAGHTVPAYQPETAFTVFTRIIQGKDIGTGNVIDLSTFGTKGPSVSDHRNKVPKDRDDICWIRSIFETCTTDQIEKMVAGEGVVMNGIWFEDEDKFHPPSTTVFAGKPGSLPTNGPTGTNREESPTTTSVIPLTGVYTATGTPTPTSGASSVRLRLRARQAHPLPKLLGGPPRRPRKGYSLGYLAALATSIFLGALLLIALALAAVRYYAARRHKRRFFGGPWEQPRRTPEEKPRSLGSQTPVQRTAAQPTYPTVSEPPLPPLPVRRDVEQPDMPSEPPPPPPPPFDIHSTPRRHSPPLDPIPEARSVRHASSSHSRSSSPLHPTEPLDPTSRTSSPPPGNPAIVQRNATSPSHSITPPSSSNGFRRSSAPLDTNPHSTPQSPKRVYSPPPEPSRAATIPPSPEEPQPVPEPEVDPKPSLFQRIRSGWRNSIGSSETAPSVLQELHERVKREDKDATQGVEDAETNAPKPVQKAPTAPPFV